MNSRIIGALFGFADQFNTVRNDVQIALRYGGITLYQRRALLLRAYRNHKIENEVRP